MQLNADFVFHKICVLGAVMYQFIIYFLALVFSNSHNLTKIILKLFAESKQVRIFASIKRNNHEKFNRKQTKRKNNRAAY